MPITLETREAETTSLGHMEEILKKLKTFKSFFPPFLLHPTSNLSMKAITCALTYI